MPSKKHALKVYVALDEYAEIIAKADQCGLSVSTFAKNVCLGHTIKSREDQQARRELLKVNADLGRLGGLLKMWIVDEDENAGSARALLEQIEQRQTELRNIVRKM